MRSFAPNPSGYDPDYHFKFGIEAGCSAYAAPLGFLEHGAKKYADKIDFAVFPSLQGGPHNNVISDLQKEAMKQCSQERIQLIGEFN